jgi:chromosomal replication initiation ATPase DnaA
MIPLAIVCTAIVVGNLTYLIITDNHKLNDMNNTSKTLQYNQEQLNKDVDEFVERIANVRGYTTEDLKSKSRKREIVIVRQMVCYLTRKHFASRFLSFQRIGERVNRDHSSVIYSYREIENMLENKDKHVTDLFNEILCVIGSNEKDAA